MRHYGFIKPSHDAHTLGINAIASQLLDCYQEVHIADATLSKTNHNGEFENPNELAQWLMDNQITHCALSYRLDEIDAFNTLSSLVAICSKHHLRTADGGRIEKLYFAGLAISCKKIEAEFKDEVILFVGSESMNDVLLALDLENDEIPESLIIGSRYDQELMHLANEFIQQFDSEHFKVEKNDTYKEYGTRKDTLSLRLANHQKKSQLPLTRLHVGPYLQDRKEALRHFKKWCKQLAKSGHLDILSIGSSQLTQSKFREDWEGLANGGGVPIQNEAEFEAIYEASRPMLVRTYSGTKNIDQLAPIYERSINIAWHALSLWWFNQLDGRGPNDLLTNLDQSIRTLKFIAASHKPYEPNTPHHFAFRGADDVTYILSAVLAARLAKQEGIQHFILQVMLNTPRYTWGIVDIAKARAILQLIKPLENENFKITLQPRAGLDFFAPDENLAKAQLAMVSMVMDDIEPHINNSPPIIHVVSYSEALHLADPTIMDESIKISCGAIEHIRKLKDEHQFDTTVYEPSIEQKTNYFVHEAMIVLSSIEKHVHNYLSAQGFYDIYKAGYLPTPYLWNSTEQFENAIYFKSRYENGSTILIDINGNKVTAEQRIRFAEMNLNNKS